MSKLLQRYGNFMWILAGLKNIMEEYELLGGKMKDNLGHESFLSDFLDKTYKLGRVEICYRSNIVITLDKLLGKTENEHIGLHHFIDDIKSQKISNFVSALYSDHQLLIKRIENNRDKLYAHTDIDHTEKLKYSSEDIELVYKTFDTHNDYLDNESLKIKEGSKMELTTQDKTLQRYSYKSLMLDFPEIKVLIKKIEEVMTSISKQI